MEREYISEKIRGTLQKLEAGSFMPENGGTIATVGEISRMTRIPVYQVLERVATGIKVNGYIAETAETKKRILTPQPSKRKDKISAAIENEGQRYQRRPQFPRPGAKGKPTSELVSRKTINSQVANEPIVLTRLDTSRTYKEQVEEKEQMLAKKKLRFSYFSNSKSEIQNAKSNADLFLNSVCADSVVPPERPNRIKELITQDSLNSKIPVIINWICPRGTDLSFDDKTEKLFRSFVNINPQQGFESDYQILPRLGLERTLCKKLQRFSPNAVYLKIVADDNPDCLYPASLRIDGREQTMATIQLYTKYCQNRFDQLIPNFDGLEVQTWTEILGSQLYKEYLRIFNQTKLTDLMPYLPDNIVETVIDTLNSHTQPSVESQKYFRIFAEDYIRQLAVEGLFLYKIFRDDVVLAWNDSTKIGRAIDALRLKRGLPVLPKIYVLHEKRGGVIINDF